MDHNIKDTVLNMIRELDDSDKYFLQQLRIIIQKHLERKGRR